MDSEELASSQQELEVLSQQFSLKFLENGHLVQALDAERKALCQCQQENQDLRTRNQVRAPMTSTSCLVIHLTRQEDEQLKKESVSQKHDCCLVVEQELSGHLAAEITRLCSLAKQDDLPLSRRMDVYEMEVSIFV